MALTWGGAAEALIAGPPVDLSRQRNGDMVLSVSIRLDGPLAGPVELGFGRERMDIAPLLGDPALGQWREVRIRLACFGGADADVTAVDTPFALRSETPLRLSLADIRLGVNQAGASCPPSGG